MAIFDFKGNDVYYETHGQGDPLIVLNGIFMSCASWAPLVPAFSARCRLILLDLLDQGKSARLDHEYTQQLQAEVVVGLMDHLGLKTADLMGISYGGEVLMHLAADYPDKVRKLILAHTCPYTTPWLKDIGRSWLYAFQSYDGHQFFKTCIPSVYSPRFYEENYEWASAREDMFVRVFTPEIYDGFARLTRAAETHDAREKLPHIKAKTLVISADEDHVTPPYQQEYLAQRIPGAALLVIKGSGHASMYEKPVEFTAAVLGFLAQTHDIKII